MPLSPMHWSLRTLAWNPSPERPKRFRGSINSIVKRFGCAGCCLEVVYGELRGQPSRFALRD